MPEAIVPVERLSRPTVKGDDGLLSCPQEIEVAPLPETLQLPEKLLQAGLGQAEDAESAEDYLRGNQEIPSKTGIPILNVQSFRQNG